ncbi:unannotated protein [freshwater metagenome]|uniref:Unannotated protein n=1 Tax=freshwater metagenome TaxID=449393 RepID=A0A6J7DL70_9ZZZZ
MEFEIVELDNNPVDLVLEVVTVIAVTFHIGDRPGHIGNHGPVRRGRHPPQLQEVINLRLVPDRRIVPRPDSVNVKAQALQTILHEFQLAFVFGLCFLPKTPRRGIARVCKGLLAERGLSCIKLVKLDGSEKHFTSNLDDIGVTIASQFLWNRGDEPNVLGHVFTRNAITTRRRLDEDAVFITHAKRKSVDLHFTQPPHRLAGIAFGLGHPFAEFLDRKHVVEAIQTVKVHDRVEQRRVRSGDTLGRTVLTLDFREFPLDLIEPAQQFVIICIRNERLVSGIVGIREFRDCVPQFRGLRVRL